MTLEISSDIRLKSDACDGAIVSAITRIGAGVHIHSLFAVNVQGIATGTVFINPALHLIDIIRGHGECGLVAIREVGYSGTDEVMGPID